MECVGFFIATLAIEFYADTRIATILCENPFAVSHWRIMANVLPVTTFQYCSPMVFIVFVETGYLLLHQLIVPTVKTDIHRLRRLRRFLSDKESTSQLSKVNLRNRRNLRMIILLLCPAHNLNLSSYLKSVSTNE